MIFILEIGMLVAGILALAKGKLTFSKNRIVEGTAARVVGLILVLPLPLAFGIGVVIGFLTAFPHGVQRRPGGVQDFQDTLTLMELAIVLVCGVLAAVVGFAYSSRPSPKPLRDAMGSEYDPDATVPLAEEASFHVPGEEPPVAEFADDHERTPSQPGGATPEGRARPPS